MFDPRLARTLVPRPSQEEIIFDSCRVVRVEIREIPESDASEYVTPEVEGESTRRYLNNG